MRIKTFLLSVGELKLALEDITIPSHTVVGAVAVIVFATFIWAII